MPESIMGQGRASEDGRLLVAGATGYIGSHVARAMRDAGYRVRALTRDQRRLERVRDACDEVFVSALHTDQPAAAWTVLFAAVPRAGHRRDIKRA